MAKGTSFLMFTISENFKVLIAVKLLLPILAATGMSMDSSFIVTDKISALTGRPRTPRGLRNVNQDKGLL